MARIDDLYRELAKKYHPDRSSPEKRDFNSAMMAAINICYQRGALEELERLSRLDEATPTPPKRPTPPPSPPAPPTPETNGSAFDLGVWARSYQPSAPHHDQPGAMPAAVRQKWKRDADTLADSRDFPRIRLLKEYPILKYLASDLDEAQTEWNDADRMKRQDILDMLIGVALLVENRRKLDGT